MRACPPDWLEELGAYAARERLPLHVHADEQPREVEECLAEHGVRPIELLARSGCLGERTTVVHATHADGAELDLLAEAGARVCACPTTEANLGDGFLPVERLLARGIAICIGSDSNVRIDPLEELRELEGIARRQSGRRNVIAVDDLIRVGADEGQRRSGWTRGLTCTSTRATARSRESTKVTCAPRSSSAPRRTSFRWSEPRDLAFGFGGPAVRGRDQPRSSAAPLMRGPLGAGPQVAYAPSPLVPKGLDGKPIPPTLRRG